MEETNLTRSARPRCAERPHGNPSIIARLGIDVTGRKRASSMGVYLRPGITRLEVGETTMAAYEAMLEVNFTFYGMQ